MELWKDGPQSVLFRLGTDAVLRADFVNIGARRRGIDLGCGSGILPLLLLTRSTALHMTGLELNPEAARVARENIAVNALDDRCNIVVGDIRRCRDEFKTGQFDLVVSNPPYFAAGSGTLSPNADKAVARGEGFEAKRLRTAAHKPGKEPSLVLIEARRGAGSGLKIMPPLHICGDDGRESAEIKRIYHRED